MFTEGNILAKRKNNICNIFIHENAYNYVFKLDMNEKVLCAFKLKMKIDTFVPIYFVFKKQTSIKQISHFITKSYILNNDLYMECQIHKTFKNHDVIYDFMMNKDWKPHYSMSPLGILLNISIVEVINVHRQ